MEIASGGSQFSWKWYKEYHSQGLIKSLPQMFEFQADSAAPIVLGHTIEKPEPIATAIRLGDPASLPRTVVARDESGGQIDAVTDKGILDAYKLIASVDGIFREPVLAASLAGGIKKYRKGVFDKGKTIGCTLTGNGFKDPDMVFKGSGDAVKVESDLADVRKMIDKIL